MGSHRCLADVNAPEKLLLQFEQILQCVAMCSLNNYERVPWGRAAYANACVRQWPSRQHFGRLHQISLKIVAQMAASMD